MDIACEVCNGSGRCAHCAGTGRIHALGKGEVACVTCAGGGKCSVCGGSGRMTE